MVTGLVLYQYLAGLAVSLPGSTCYGYVTANVIAGSSTSNSYALSWDYVVALLSIRLHILVTCPSLRTRSVRAQAWVRSIPSAA